MNREVACTAVATAGSVGCSTSAAAGPPNFSSTSSEPGSLWRRGLAALVRNWLALRYRVFSHRSERLTLEQVDDLSLLVLPTVFNPALLRTGAWFAAVLQQLQQCDGWSAQEPRVLDLGTGSGVLAIRAAKMGARVVATDLNPEAVRCARLNALLNHVEDRVAVHEGDLFEAVRGQQFDVVLCNPPFYRGHPRSPRDLAWRGHQFFERFAQALPHHLRLGGYGLLILSSDGDGDQLLAELVRVGFDLSVAARTDLLNEVLTIYAVRRESTRGT